MDADKIPEWAVRQINIAAGSGLIKGYGSNGRIKFMPNQTLSRSEMAVIISRILNVKLAEESTI